MKRKIDENLITWSKSDRHKPILLRGPRQVGKTFAVRNLGKSFRYFAEINFDEDRNVHSFFDGPLTIAPLLTKLEAYTQVPIRAGETLLFLDELQACPNAIRSLRYFAEQMPGLHVVGAGSLLEFALADLPSFGVGRITMRHLYPMSFMEFLDASGLEFLHRLADEADFDHPLDPVLHARIIEQLKTYLLVGGMPEAVATFLEHHELAAAGAVLVDEISTYRSDFEKYRGRIPALRLDETFRSVARQAGHKFVCAEVDREERSTAIRAALELLRKAGLVHLAYRAAANGIPIC